MYEFLSPQLAASQSAVLQRAKPFLDKGEDIPVEPKAEVMTSTCDRIIKVIQRMSAPAFVAKQKEELKKLYDEMTGKALRDSFCEAIVSLAKITVRQAGHQVRSVSASNASSSNKSKGASSLLPTGWEDGSKVLSGQSEAISPEIDRRSTAGEDTTAEDSVPVTDGADLNIAVETRPVILAK